MFSTVSMSSPSTSAYSASKPAETMGTVAGWDVEGISDRGRSYQVNRWNENIVRGIFLYGII